MRDGAHERTDPAIVAAKLENFLHHRAILALEVAGRAGWGRNVRTLVDGHAQDAIRVGVRRARHGPVERHERGDAAAARRDPLGDLRDHANFRVTTASSRDEQYTRIATVRRECHRHAGEHDHIIQRNQFEGCHESEITPNT